MAPAMRPQALPPPRPGSLPAAPGHEQRHSWLARTELGKGGSDEARPGQEAGQSPARAASRRARAASTPASASAGRRLARSCRERPAKSSGAPTTLYWGAWIGNQLTGDEAPWDMGAVSKFEGMAGKGLSVVNFSSPFADCSSSPCSFYEFPTEPMESIREHGAIPFFSWASQSTPSQPQPARLPARRRDRRHLRLLHPRIRRRSTRLGAPLLPPLQLGDERQLVRLDGGRQRQPARRVRRRLAPRARHLHRGRRRPTRPGSGAPTSIRKTRCGTSPRSIPATPTSTGPASTATTGGPTRRGRTSGAASTSSTDSTYAEITETIAPSKPMMIGEIGSTEYGGSKAAWIEDTLEHGRRPTTPRSAACSGSRSSTTAWTGRSRPRAARPTAFAEGIQEPVLPDQRLRQPRRRADRTAELSSRSEWIAKLPYTCPLRRAESPA